MSDVFIDNPEEQLPEENPSPPEQELDKADLPIPPSPSEPSNDPLSDLRKDLFEEEQSPQTSTVKPDLLRRMTGNLSPRRGSTRTGDEDQPRSRFGVRTAGKQPSASEKEGIGDSIIEEPQHDRQSGYPSSRWRQSVSVEPEPETASDDLLEEDVESPPSKVRPPISRRRDTIWDGTENGEAEEGEALIKTGEKTERGSEDRKRLSSGFERQQTVSRFISYNPKQSLRARIQGMSPVERILLSVLIFTFLGVLVFVGYLYLESRQPGFVQRNILPPSASPTATVASVPNPVGLRLPGGWYFQLGSGMMVDGKWAPTKSEWLVGTEIRRVIAIPWNKQIEAVVRTFDTNDPINVEMTNGDVLVYKVKSVAYMPVSDSSILYDTSPSLAVILIRPGDNSRWVVIAAP